MGSQSGAHGVNGGNGNYFGDSDDSYGDMGDAGWGDGGVDSGSGGESNPGESGNDQNPGGQQAADYSNLRHTNTQTPSAHAHRTYNSSGVTLHGKGENGDNRVTVAPGGYTDEELDAFEVGGFVFKGTDRYVTLTVTDIFYYTDYSNEDIFWPAIGSPLEMMEDWLADPGNPCQRTDFVPNDVQWNNIFLPP